MLRLSNGNDKCVSTVCICDYETDAGLQENNLRSSQFYVACGNVAGAEVYTRSGLGADRTKVLSQSSKTTIMTLFAGSTSACDFKLTSMCWGSNVMMY